MVECIVPRLTVGTRMGTAVSSPSVPSSELRSTHVRASLILRQSSKKLMTMVMLAFQQFISGKLTNL